MSDGNKKPGLRDISDLKARLGMLNTGAGPGAPRGPRPPGAAPGNPFAPKAPATPSAPPPPDAAAAPPPPVGSGPPAAPGMPAVPSAPPAAPPAAPRAPAAPAAPSGLSVGGDLFKKPPPQAAPAAAQARPQARSSQADQAQLEAMFDAPSRQVLDEAPKPEAEFANPLQQGEYAQAAAPVDLTAEEEAALSSYEHKQVGMKPTLAIGMTVGVGVLMLFIGYAIGDSIRARRFINAQIDASERVKGQLQDPINTYEKLRPILLSMNPQQVEWDKVKALPELPDVSGAIFATPVPLHPDLAPRVARFVVDLNALYEALKEHERITTKRDKAELEAMEAGSSFLQRPSFAVLYDPVDPEASGPYIPPVGKIVAVTGRPVEKEVERKVGRRKKMVTEYFLPIIDRQGKEAEVNLRRLLQIKKDQFLAAGEANPLSLYEKRVTDLKARITQIDTYFDLLQDALKTQAEREKVFSL